MVPTIQKDIEKESNLSKMPREFLVGGKETWKIKRKWPWSCIPTQDLG